MFSMRFFGNITRKLIVNFFHITRYIRLYSVILSRIYRPSVGTRLPGQFEWCMENTMESTGLAFTWKKNRYILNRAMLRMCVVLRQHLSTLPEMLTSIYKRKNILLRMTLVAHVTIISLSNYGTLIVRRRQPARLD